MPIEVITKIDWMRARARCGQNTLTKNDRSILVINAQVNKLSRLLIFFIKFACIINKWRQIFIGWFPAHKKNYYHCIARLLLLHLLFNLFFFWSKKKWLDGKIFVFNCFFLRWKIRVNRILMVMWLCRTNVWCLLVLARSCK